MTTDDKSTVDKIVQYVREHDGCTVIDVAIDVLGSGSPRRCADAREWLLALVERDSLEMEIVEHVWRFHVSEIAPFDEFEGHEIPMTIEVIDPLELDHHGCRFVLTDAHHVTLDGLRRLRERIDLTLRLFDEESS